MSRKDTIVIAALVNAGLLVVLFVSALRNRDGGDKLSLQKESSALLSNEVIALVESKKAIGDEVDFVLNQYTQKDPLQAPVATPQSFADDVQLVSTPVPEVAKEETPAWIEVKVKKGDMLEKIARQHRTTVTEIMKVNQLSSTQLKIGQVLKIYPSKEPLPALKAQNAILDAVPSHVYTVKTGDNPWTIAVKNHMKVDDLLKLNNMTEEKARRLKPGDQIRIR